MKALHANFVRSTQPRAKTARNQKFPTPFDPKNSLKIGRRVRVMPADPKPIFALQPSTDNCCPPRPVRKKRNKKFAYTLRTQQMVANTDHLSGSCTPIPSPFTPPPNRGAAAASTRSGWTRSDKAILMNMRIAAGLLYFDAFGRARVSLARTIRRAGRSCVNPSMA